MRLDARYPDLDFSLQTWHRRLNRRYLWGEAFVGWSAATVFAAAAVFEPSQAARWSVWLTSGTAVALAYTLWQSRLRLTRHQAASWLDEAARTTGVFRAASECLDRPHPGAPERAVLDEASRQLPRGVRVPWRRLGLRAGLALLLSAASVFLVTAPPAPSRLASAGSESAPAAPRTEPGAPGSRELTSREAAKRLFPENERLAALAEQALASGDPGALESLLDQNSGEADPAAAAEMRSGSGPDGNSAEGSQDHQGGKDGSNGAGSGQQQRPGSGDSGQGGSEESSRSGGDSQRSGGSGQPGVGGMSQGPGGRQDGSGNDQRRAGDSPFSSGGAAGDGHSDLTFGPAAKGRSRQNLTLKEGENPGLFEYVLPGTGPRLPAAGALADSKRSAEAALARTTPPLEYENAVRDYFLSLSQEVSP